MMKGTLDQALQMIWAAPSRCSISRAGGSAGGRAAEAAEKLAPADARRVLDEMPTC